MQSPTAFDMMPYLLGLKGPAQCVDLSADPLRINVVPRDGGEHIVSPPFEASASAVLIRLPGDGRSQSSRAYAACQRPASRAHNS